MRATAKKRFCELWILHKPHWRSRNGFSCKPDKSGKYAKQTLVRRYCNDLPRNNLLQAETYADGLASEWQLKYLPDCRFAGQIGECMWLKPCSRVTPSASFQMAPAPSMQPSTLLRVEVQWLECAGCDEKQLLGKLMFDAISSDGSEVVKFSEDKSSNYHQSGSKVTAKKHRILLRSRTKNMWGRYVWAEPWMWIATQYLGLSEM